ncbi:glycosyltransferase family 4 protein, partial [Halopseudomonas pertucinogena]|uniref:glycosyltransferase family 4 protein n=1 Tax=Halopseudomonas pertucinogena TaxID=86175 RepID=UPI001E5743E5
GGGGMKADPKRIWIINQYASLPSTGIGGRHRHLSRELARLGHRVTLIAARWTHGTRDTEAADDAPEQESFEGFRFIRISVGKYKHAHDKKRILNWLVFGVRLLQLQKKLGERPDVIIYSSPSLIGFLSAYYLSRKFKARLIFEVRDIWPLTLVQLGGFSPSHPFIVFLQKIEDLAYKKSHKVISNLRESHHHMVARGLDREKFAWVPNGVSIHEVSAVEPAPELMVSEFKKQPFSVVYAGTVGAANSLETLIMAASLLKDVTDIHFNIVGKGQKTHDLSVLINDLELTNVHLWPSVKKTQVQSVLSVMDVCYIGLTKDPLFRYGVSPNKLFDYMYSARPVVYSIDSGGYCPISEANAGIQIEPESPEEAAGAILALYNMSPEKREIMGRNARLAVLEKYEYSAIARTLESVVLDRAE